MPTIPTHRPRFLTVLGILHPDNRLQLVPGFTTGEAAFAAEDPESGVTVEITDAGGRTLVRHRITAGPMCADGVELRELMVAGKVPFPDEARGMRVMRDDVLVGEFEIPAEGPAVKLRWRQPAAPVTGTRKVAWSAQHPEGLELTHLLAYSHDAQRWQPLSPPTPSTEAEIDFDVLPGGRKCRLAVLTSDGFNTTRTESKPFAVAVSTCQAFLLAPEPGTEVAADDRLTLRGQGYWLEEDRPEREDLRWASSIDGPLGEGTIVQVTGLSPGEHVISLEAGSGDRVGRAETTIAVA